MERAALAATAVIVVVVAAKRNFDLVLSAMHKHGRHRSRERVVPEEVQFYHLWELE